MKFRDALAKLAGLTTGSALAQLLLVACLPILTRLYKPEDFAILGLYTAVVSICAAVLTFRADRMLIFADDRQEISRMVSTFVVLLAAGSAIGLLLALIVGLVFRGFQLLPLIGAVVAAPLLALSAVFIGWLTKSFDTSGIVTSQIVRSVASLALQIVVGMLIAGPLGLVAGALAGVVASSAYLVLRDRARGAVGWSALRGARASQFSWSEAKGFLWASGQAGVNAFSNNLPLLAVSAIFPLGAAGRYVLADRMVRLPISLISNNIRNYVAALARSAGGPNLAFMIRLSMLMGGAAAVVLVVLALYSEPLFRLVFGPEWIGAGRVATVLFILTVANFLSLPFQAYVMSMKQYRAILMIELMSLLLKAVAIALVHQMAGDLVWFAFVVAMATSLYYASMVALFFTQQRKSTPGR